MSVVMKEKQYNLDIPFFFLEQPLTWRRQCSTNICKVKSAAFHSESKHCSCGASQLSCSGEGGPDERSEPIGTNLWKTKSRQIFILTVLCTSNTSDHREYLSCCPDVRVFCEALGSHRVLLWSVLSALNLTSATEGKNNNRQIELKLVAQTD